MTRQDRDCGLLRPTDGNTTHGKATPGRRIWKRTQPGVYVSGPYVVERLDTGEWYSSACDRVFDRKAQAQASCEEAEK